MRGFGAFSTFILSCNKHMEALSLLTSPPHPFPCPSNPILHSVSVSVMTPVTFLTRNHTILVFVCVCLAYFTPHSMPRAHPHVIVCQNFFFFKAK
jgi:hypothetical protein